MVTSTRPAAAPFAACAPTLNRGALPADAPRDTTTFARAGRSRVAAVNASSAARVAEARMTSAVEAGAPFGVATVIRDARYPVRARMLTPARRDRTEML